MAVAARRLVADPVLECRGWISEAGLDAFHPEAVRVVRDAVIDELSSDAPDVKSCTRAARRALGKHIQKTTRRRPVIIPIVQALTD